MSRYSTTIGKEIMLSKFLQFFLPMLKEYNKRNKGKEQVFAETELNQLLELMVKLIRLDLVEKTQHNELHLRLLSVTDFIYHVSVKRKFKDKFIELFFDDIKYFKYVESQVPDLDSKSLGVYEPLYEFELYPLKCIENHLNLLVSKTVDYLPKDEKQLKNIGIVLDFFDAYKARLYTYSSEVSKWWVYLYTEHNEDIPVSLRYLNNYGSLGDKIEDWVVQFQETPLVKLFNQRGYDVFGGWGNLSSELKLEGGKISEKEAPVETKHEYLHLTDATFKQAAAKLHEHTSMFYFDPRFEMVHPTHFELFARTCGALLANLTNYRLLHLSTVKNLFVAIRNWANHSKYLTARKDRKMWYSQDSVDAVYAYFKECCSNKITGQALLLATHVYDLCAPNPLTKDEDEATIHRAHHDYLARTHNHIYYSRKKYNEQELNYFLQAYQEVIMPKYFNLVAKENEWLFRASLEFTMNVSDARRVDVLYEQLKGWFETRHTTDLNQQFYKNNLAYFLYMSYSNKKMLLDKLTSQPIDVVNYASSKEIYEDILNIIRVDVENPIMTHRIEDIDFEEGGIVRKENDREDAGISVELLNQTKSA